MSPGAQEAPQHRLASYGSAIAIGGRCQTPGCSCCTWELLVVHPHLGPLSAGAADELHRHLQRRRTGWNLCSVLRQLGVVFLASACAALLTPLRFELAVMFAAVLLIAVTGVRLRRAVRAQLRTAGFFLDGSEARTVLHPDPGGDPALRLRLAIWAAQEEEGWSSDRHHELHAAVRAHQAEVGARNCSDTPS